VDGARDTVLQLQVHLGDGVLREDGGIGDVTDSSRLNHVADGESLDSLILGGASRAVAASDGLDVVAVSMTTWLLISLTWRKKMLCAVVDDVMDSASVLKLDDTQ
jgi:hypothetical protein